MLTSVVEAGVRNVRRFFGNPVTQPYDETAFAPHQPDDTEVLGKLYGVRVMRDEEVDVPGGIETPYGVFGPIERIGG